MRQIGNHVQPLGRDRDAQRTAGRTLQCGGERVACLAIACAHAPRMRGKYTVGDEIGHRILHEARRKPVMRRARRMTRSTTVVAAPDSKAQAGEQRLGEGPT